MKTRPYPLAQTQDQSCQQDRPFLQRTCVKIEILLSNIKYITAKVSGTIWSILDDKSPNIDQIVPLTLLFVGREGMKTVFSNLGKFDLAIAIDCASSTPSQESMGSWPTVVFSLCSPGQEEIGSLSSSKSKLPACSRRRVNSPFASMSK